MEWRLHYDSKPSNSQTKPFYVAGYTPGPLLELTALNSYMAPTRFIRESPQLTIYPTSFSSSFKRHNSSLTQAASVIFSSDAPFGQQSLCTFQSKTLQAANTLFEKAPLPCHEAYSACRGAVCGGARSVLMRVRM